MIDIQIPTALRKMTGGKSTVAVPAGTVAQALSELARQYPDVGRNILDESGKPRNFVNIFLGDEDIRHLQGFETQIADGQKILLVPSIAGGL